MKTTIALILLCFSSACLAQLPDSSGIIKDGTSYVNQIGKIKIRENAKWVTAGGIKKVDDVEIFMQSEPITLYGYDIIGDVLPAGMNMHMDSMDHLCEHFIKRAQKKYPGEQFDALVFLNNWRAQVIRYRKNKS